MSATDHLSGLQFVHEQDGPEGRVQAKAGRAHLETTDHEGRVGDRGHITRISKGYLPTSAVANMSGVKGEVPGEHRHRHGEKWESFKGDIAEHGIRNPIFNTHDYGEQPKISEGNHRRDAAVELGMTHVPVEIRHFGHAERGHSW